MEVLDQALEQLKQIGIKHGKAAMLETAEVVLPLVLEAVKQAIPGPIDDAVIEAAKPVAMASVKELIAKLGA